MRGLGGGVVIIPILTLLFGVPLEYAAGASLISTIATSSGAASAYVKDKLANIKIGMSLEIATTLGAIIGSLLAAYVYANGISKWLFVLFGAVLLLSLYPTFRQYEDVHRKRINQDWSTDIFQLRGSYYDKAVRRTIKYSGYRWPLGEAIMGVAGLISGLLGIGSGVLKVMGMDWGMKLPMKVTTSTSNFMIGVTAVTGSAIYWTLGYIQPFIAAPVVIGILFGAYFGSKLLQRTANRSVRLLFLVLLGIIGVEMVLRGFGVA
jgi:uncharacterized membrane protein YfcA